MLLNILKILGLALSIAAAVIAVLKETKTEGDSSQGLCFASSGATV